MKLVFYSLSDFYHESDCPAVQYQLSIYYDLLLSNTANLV